MEDDAFDLYDDLEEFDYKVKYEESEAKLKELKGKLDEATKKLTLLEEQKSELQSKIDNLERSFQSLLLTARSEIKRKDAQIADARKERDDFLFRRQKQPQFNKQNPFHTNAKPPENRGIITKVTNDTNNKNDDLNKNNENKTQENPGLKNCDNNEKQPHIIETTGKLPPVESSAIKNSNDTNRCENQIPSHNASNDKVENKSDLQMHKPEKTIPDYKSRSRSHEKPHVRETNIQNNDEANIQKGVNHGSRLENHTEDKCKDKNDNKKNDFKRHSPSTTKMDDVRNRNSKDSNDRRNDHHSYRESRDHRERGHHDRDRRNTDRDRGSKDHERGNNDREKEHIDREKQNSNREKVNVDLDRRKSDREGVDKDRERGNKDRDNESKRDKDNNEYDKANTDRVRSGRERGNNDRERRNNDREKQKDREIVNNDRDRRNNDREREHKGRETRNNAREKENDSRDKLNNDRNRRNADRSRAIDRDEGNNARDKRYNDRDRNRVRQPDRHREHPIKNSDSDHHKMDRERERNKDKNRSNSNEDRIHNQEREKADAKKIESRRNVVHKLIARDDDRNDKLDPISGRSLRESNRKDKDLAHNKRDDSEGNRRRNEDGILEEKLEPKYAGRKRQRQDEPTKEESKPNKSSPSKKRKYAERKQDQVTSKNIIGIETIEPDAIDSFSEDHLEALKRQLEMQLNGEISNDAKFSSEEGEIPEQADILVEPTPSSNLNTNAANDSADAENNSKVKSSAETNDIKNITNESDYTQVDMEIEPPRSVQVDVAPDNITCSPFKKTKQEVEEVVPICKKKRAMSTLNAIERSEEKKSKNTERASNTVDAKRHHNHEKLDNPISDASKESNSNQIKEHVNEHSSVSTHYNVNPISLFMSTECDKLDKESPTANALEQKQSKDIDVNKKKPFPFKTNNSRDDRKQVILNSHETSLNECNKKDNHQLPNDNTAAVQANKELDNSENKGKECEPKIVDHSISTNTESVSNSDVHAKGLESNNEKKETYRRSFSETSSDFSPIRSSSDSNSDDQSSSECTTHSSSSQSHSEEEQERKNDEKSSPQMLKEAPVSTILPNLDASIDAKNASSGNRFQSSLESLKNGEENEEEVLETPIKLSKHVKTYRIQKNDAAQSDTILKIIATPSKIVQEKEDQSKISSKRKRDNESNESSIKRSKTDVDSNKNDNATSITEMEFDSLSTNQLDALEKQLAFEVYGENIYEGTTKDIKKEQKNQSLNLFNDSIFGSNELNSSADKERILTNDNEVKKIDADRDKLGHRILKEIGLEESEQNVKSSDHASKVEENQTINKESMHHNQESVSKQISEVDEGEADPCLALTDVKVENQSNTSITSNQSTDSAEVEILGTIEILPSRAHDIQHKTTVQYTKGPQRNTRKKSTEIPPSNQLKTVSSDVENKRSSQATPNLIIPRKIKKETASKDPPAKRGARRKVNEKPKTICNENPFDSLDIESLKESNRIIKKTKDGIWLECDCVSSKSSPVVENSNLLAPIPECPPGALGIPLPGNVTSKEDTTVTPGKLLEENKAKQRRTKSNDSQQSTKSTSKSKSNVKMIGHIIEGFEREPSPAESKLDTSRDLKHELFKEALGITNSTPCKSDFSGASKVSDSSSNESVTETTDKKIADDLESVKSKSNSKMHNHLNNLNIKTNSEKVSNSKPFESTDKEYYKEEIIPDDVDPVSSSNKVPNIESVEDMSAQIEILDVQIIQGCALNEAKDELKCDIDLPNIPKDLRMPMSCKNVEKLKDQPTTDLHRKQEPVVSRNRNRSSKTKEVASQLKTPLKHQEKQKDASKSAKKTDKCSSLSKESTKNPKSLDSSNRGGSSNNRETIPQSKDCDIQKPTPEHVQTARKSPVANEIETLTSTQQAPLTDADPCPSTPSVAKLAEIPTCNENSPNNSILNRSQHEKRNISIASTDYVIEKVDNNVVNVFITRKKVKKKKKV